jgi:hypothetical protein
MSAHGQFYDAVKTGELENGFISRFLLLSVDKLERKRTPLVSGRIVPESIAQDPESEGYPIITLFLLPLLSFPRARSGRARRTACPPEFCERLVSGDQVMMDKPIKMEFVVGQG